MADNAYGAKTSMQSTLRPAGKFEARGALWQSGGKLSMSSPHMDVDGLLAGSDTDLSPKQNILSRPEFWMVAYVQLLVLIALAVFISLGS